MVAICMTSSVFSGEHIQNLLDSVNCGNSCGKDIFLQVC